MARSRVRHRKRQKRRTETRRAQRLPLVASVGIMAGFLAAYLGAEMFLSARLDPVHWVVAGSGGGLGYLAGMVWYQLRGDIV